MNENQPKPIEWSDKEGFYASVGQGISAWVVLEMTLVFLFSRLLSITPRQAGLVLYSIMNFYTWLTLITDLFASEPKFAHLRGAWNKKFERLRALNDTRTRLAHHTTFESEGLVSLKPSRLDIRPKSLAYEPLQDADIVKFTSDVSDLQTELMAIIEAVESLTPSVGISEEPNPGQQH
ncbi:MAG: hypothetical protein QOG55_986 [Acidobacteriaceae bacterium]|jgi:hypothetical protein|nr:hypothetical protein [Acidobacteriaceae bacterium]